MARTLYRYNSEKCLYEPVFPTTKQTLYRTILFLGLCFVTAAGCLYYYTIHFPSLDEVKLKRENEDLKWQWETYQEKINAVSNQLSNIEQTDDNHYRVLLNMSPLESSIRTAGSGGHEPYVLEESDKLPEIISAYESLDQVQNRLEVEAQSLKELENEITVKEKMTSTRPALMPIDNRQLTRFNSIFGMRLHPVYRDWRNHNGLDLTAPQGTPVYATGDGIVTMASFNGGYGNVIFLNHGFGFETRYGHLSKYNIINGQHVKRGDLIGFVGNTGVSTTPHLHYEVLYQGKYVNPINFMYRDLKQNEYNKIITNKNKISTRD